MGVDSEGNAFTKGVTATTRLKRVRQCRDAVSKLGASEQCTDLFNANLPYAQWVEALPTKFAIPLT